MKILRCWLVYFCSLFWIASCLRAESIGGPEGHWEGGIKLPNTNLAMGVNLTHDQEKGWAGTIDIPAQGVKGFKLGGVNVDAAAITFLMENVPGNPHFKGHFDAAANSISGDFTQGGHTVPFNLERKNAALPVVAVNEPIKGKPGSGLEDIWLGSIKVTETVSLQAQLELKHARSENPEGELLSIDQGTRTPVSGYSEKAGLVHIDFSKPGASFEGKLNADGSELSGEWMQGGRTFPLVFRRTGKAVSLARPQEPKKPYPYDEEDVVVKTPDAAVTLAGTLTLPKGTGPYPAVVLITGSGAQDRDEALMGHRPFLVIADYLTRQGIAVLRCDDRGTAKSTGNFAQARESDFVQDTEAAVAYLRGRKEINPAKIGLIGHSEGGMVAPRVAIELKDISYIVLLAGPGLPLSDVVLRQSADMMRVMGASEDSIEASRKMTKEVFEIARSEPDDKLAESKIKASIDQMNTAIVKDQKQAEQQARIMNERAKMVLSPWFRDMLTYDPRTTLEKVKCPVLALNGEKDLQVAAKENLDAIRDALTKGGNTHFKTIALPRLNHLFQTSLTGSPLEYGKIEQTFAPAALQLISDWILKTASNQ